MKALVGWLLALLALAGCLSGPRVDLPKNPPNFAAPDAPTPIAVNEDYKLSPLDKITVTVFQVPDLSGDHQIDATGRITLPLIGEVMAQGRTSRDLATDIGTKYSQKYLSSPEVQVSVKETVSQRVTVEGSVMQPGVFPISGQTTLIQAIAMARGVSDFANSSRVLVFRQISGKRQAAVFDLRAIRAGAMMDPALYGNDVIVVDGSSTRKTFRDIIQSIPLLAIFGPF